MKTSMKKRAEKQNDRIAYDVHLIDEDTGGIGDYLGWVSYAGKANGGGEKWRATDPDGRNVSPDYSSGTTCFQRNGAVEALVRHRKRKDARLARKELLLTIGVVIDDGQYLFDGRRIFSKIGADNMTSDGAVSTSDVGYAKNWRGWVYGSNLKLIDFPTEAALLSAAIKALDLKPCEAILEYNKKATSVLAIHEEYTPDGLRYRTGHSKDQRFETPYEALAFVLGNLTLEVDNVKEALKKVKGV